MDNLQQLRSRARLYLFGMVIFENIVLLGIGWGLYGLAGIGALPTLGALLAIGAAMTFLLVHVTADFLTQPVKALWQTILYLNPNTQGVEPPKIAELRLGRELVANLSSQIYQLISVADAKANEADRKAGDLRHNFIAQNLPLPLVLLDSSENIKFVNEAAAEYIGIKTEDMIGKNVYMVLDMSFPARTRSIPG